MKRLAMVILTIATSIACYATDDVGNFIPPKGHPRLLIRPDDIPAVKQRMRTETGRTIIERMEKLSVPMSEKEAARQKWNTFNPYMKMRGVTTEAQLNALRYVVDGDKKAGRKAVTQMLDTLKRAQFGTKNDLSRPNGAMVFISGMVYDWCFPLLKESEKQEYIREIIRCCGKMECHYPDIRYNALCGHSSERMLLKDMLGAGIAIYDEYPELYEKVLKVLVDDFIPGRNHLFKGHSYHQGISYMNARMEGDLTCHWIFKSAGAGDVFSEDMREVLYEVIYRRCGDNLMLRAGDCGAKSGFYSTIMMLGTALYHDPYLQYEFEKAPAAAAPYIMFELLYRDFDIKGKAPDDLPLNRWFPSPCGSMISRTGWGKNDVVAEMRMIEQFVGNHQHHDAGTFQIYYKGFLANDTGYYSGSGYSYGDAHNNCYAKRTIAHNGLLIYDPDESFGNKRFANDGGQRIPDHGRQCSRLNLLVSDDYKYGKTLSHWFDNDFSLLKCDITAAYNPSKVKDVRRSFVFMNLHDSIEPAALVVFDHIVSTNRDFKKYFLLHSSDEAVIKGNTATVTAAGKEKDKGMLMCTTLLPDNAAISTVGGEGKEFWVFGKNYKAEGDKRPVNDVISRWRTEICPSKAAEEDCFLNVIQIADAGTSLPEPERVDGTSVIGTALLDRIVMFSRTGDILSEGFDFTVPGGMATRKILLTDLASGKWTITLPDGSSKKYDVVDSENNIIFEGFAGKYNVHKN